MLEISGQWWRRCPNCTSSGDQGTADAALGDDPDADDTDASWE
jgi:hypothetical protein